MRHRHTEELVRRYWGAHTGGHGSLEILRHIGPGLIVTGGFIDPGKWTSNMAAGTISAGAFGEEYDIHDRHSTGGIVLCFVFALVTCLLVEDSFQGLLVSQALLSLQLPIAVFLQIYLTSSSEVMGAYANSLPLKLRLLAIGIFVAVLDVLLMI